MGIHLPEPGQTLPLDQETEKLRKEFAAWVRENSDSFKKKPERTLKELEHPQKQEKAKALLTTLGLLKKGNVVAILQNPLDESFPLRHQAPSYLLSLDPDRPEDIVCQKGVLDIPPGLSMAIYTS